MNKTERRVEPKKSEKELYGISNIDSFIEKERRHDELDRLREVREQKQVWLKTVLFCGLLNLVLICLAIWGAL